VIHAALANLKRPTFAKLASFALVWLPVLLFMLCKTWLGLHAPVLYLLLTALFLGLIVIGVPVGFVLAVIGVVCV
jgi:hypothetical protein